MLAVDESLGALLIEEIEPGTPLVDSARYPTLESVAELMTSLHASGERSYPPLEQRVAYLFDAARRLYDVHPERADRVPPGLYERGRRLALRLAADASPRVLLHGDLTPSNILDGGAERGLVAIDPAACVGDAPFDAVDLVFWRSDGIETIERRSNELAGAIGAAPERLLAWCIAFAGMAALELASTPETPGTQLDALVELAGRAL